MYSISTICTYRYTHACVSVGAYSYSCVFPDVYVYTVIYVWGVVDGHGGVVDWSIPGLPTR